MEVPLRVRAASNPGDHGHEWVRARFVEERCPDRPFVPSRIDDNPHLDRIAYRQALAKLGGVARRQLEEGDWEVRDEGGMFDRAWFALVDSAPAIVTSRVREWDLAASCSATAKRTAGVKLSRAPDGSFCVEHVVVGKWSPGERDAVIEATAHADGVGCRIAVEQEPGSGGIAQIDALARRLVGFRVERVKATGDKVLRAGPTASQAEARNIRLVRGAWNQEFLDELEAFPTGYYMDQVDALSHGLSLLAAVSGVRVRVIGGRRGIGGAA